VQGYFPAALWYDWYSGAKTGDTGSAKTLTLQAPISAPINIHIRGGNIVPTQRPGLTTTASRVTPFTIVVALDGQGSAQGNLYLDDGEGLTTIQDKAYTLINYKAASGSLTNTIANSGYSDGAALSLEKVVVYGLTSAVNAVKVNGAATTSFTYDSSLGRLTVTGVNVPVAKSLTVQWA